MERLLKRPIRKSIAAKTIICKRLLEIKRIFKERQSFCTQNGTGVVEAIDNERARLKVSVNIFGRSTAIELANDEVEKIS